MIVNWSLTACTGYRYFWDWLKYNIIQKQYELIEDPAAAAADDDDGGGYELKPQIICVDLSVFR